MSEEYIFKTNPQKSANKVTINSFMMGSLFFVLTLIITLGSNRFSHAIIFQLFLAVPLLYVSSLAYSKIGYWKETYEWDAMRSAGLPTLPGTYLSSTLSASWRFNLV